MRTIDRVFRILVGVLVACGGGTAPTAGPTSAPPVADAGAGSPGVSQDELAWALELETQVKNGYQPTAKETARYQDIAERLSKTQPAPPASVPQTPSVTQEEIEWAVVLEEKVRSQRYQPTAEEAARYEDIAKRLVGVRDK